MEHVNENATTTNATHTAHAAGRSRYVGPSAARIAELIAAQQRVRFERGWFWTAAFCHGTEQEQDLMAFRQRPDGDGIDVRCHRAAAQGMQSVTARESGSFAHWSGWAESRSGRAYAAKAGTSAPASASEQTAANETGRSARPGSAGGSTWRLALLPFIGLLLAAPFILGFELEVAALSAVGYGWVGWLGHRALVTHRRAASVSKGGRPR